MYETFSKRAVFEKNDITDIMTIPVVGTFETVSLSMYEKLRKDLEMDEGILYIKDHSNLKVPELATSGSAGADFFLPYPIELRPGESKVIKTFMRCKIVPGWMLSVYPKSGLAFKTGMRLANTVGIIDSDYYYSVNDGPTNEGHIMIKIVAGDDGLTLRSGDKFCQGIFIPYGIASNELDRAHGTRTGGIGSTGN